LLFLYVLANDGAVPRMRFHPFKNLAPANNPGGVRDNYFLLLGLLNTKMREHNTRARIKFESWRSKKVIPEESRREQKRLILSHLYTAD
jgi:hypothetical protein